MITINVSNSLPGSTPINQTLTVNWYPGMNAQNALELAYANVLFSLSFYGYNFGYMVVMLDNLSDTPSTSTYWQFFYNGASSNSGVDSTFLNDGDTISFENTAYMVALHAGTLLEVKHLAAHNGK